MAEQEAGQQEEGQEEQLEEQEQAGAETEGGEQKQEQQAARTYTQAELDRILNKVRKNARYLGRKEAESEMVRQGASKQQAQQTVDRQEQEAPKPPKREDFEHYEDYLDARADFRARTVSKEEREKDAKAQREARVAEERRTSERAFKKRADAVIKENPGWADKIESAENVMISQTMGEEIQESEQGPRVLEYLVDNPDEAERIAQLPSKAQVKEIGKLEAKIEAQLNSKAKPEGKEGEEKEDEDETEGEDDEQSETEEKAKDAERRDDGTFKSKKKRAPEPIEPGTARSVNTNQLPSDKDDIKTWMRKEDERERREGR